MNERAERRRDHAWPALLAAAFFAGFSLPAGRFFLLLSAVLLAADAARGRRRWRMPPCAWTWLAFVALAAVVTACGVNPRKGLGKLDKLLWYAGLPVAASLVSAREQLRQAISAMLLGCGVLALRICLCNPVRAALAVRRAAQEGIALGYGEALIHQGSMTDGQRLMIGLVGAAALTLAARHGGEARRSGGAGGPGAAAGEWFARLFVRLRLPLIVLLALGELLSFKRGSWICAAVALACLFRRHVSWRHLLAGGLLLAAVVAGVPPVRQRLLDLRSELSTTSGGRMTMWTQIAPPLLREHPWGIGFRSLTNELMRETARQVGCRRLERNRDHMHSNFVEMAVSVGWAGLALYLLWMALMVADAWRGEPPPRPLFWMIAVILLNGLVEYNFADAEIVLILGLLGGLAAAARRLAEGRETTEAVCRPPA